MTEQPERAQAIDSPAEERVPLWVESPRGDDRFGTNTTTGEVISDFEAKELGVPLQEGIPQSKVQGAVEKQLKEDKWVLVEKKSGESELLTKKDIPVEDTGPGSCEHGSENDDEPEETNAGDEKKTGESWKDAFNVKPVTNPAKTDGKTTLTCSEPKKEKEVWVSKFKNIKSATATHKGKGG